MQHTFGSSFFQIFQIIQVIYNHYFKTKTKHNEIQ